MALAKGARLGQGERDGTSFETLDYRHLLARFSTVRFMLQKCWRTSHAQSGGATFFAVSFYSAPFIALLLSLMQATQANLPALSAPSGALVCWCDTQSRSDVCVGVGF